MKLTVAYYENPAALHEIKAWEKMKKKQILNCSYYNNRHEFILEDERVLCMPIDEIDVDYIKFVMLTNTYNKTLMFGKITAQQLIDISLITLKLEQGRIY